MLQNSGRMGGLTVELQCGRSLCRRVGHGRWRLRMLQLVQLPTLRVDRARPRSRHQAPGRRWAPGASPGPPALVAPAGPPAGQRTHAGRRSGRGTWSAQRPGTPAARIPPAPTTAALWRPLQAKRQLQWSAPVLACWEETGTPATAFIIEDSWEEYRTRSPTLAARNKQCRCEGKPTAVRMHCLFQLQPQPHPCRRQRSDHGPPAWQHASGPGSPRGLSPPK